MKFVLAPDSFKDSLTAQEVARAMEAGIHKVFPDAHCVQIPMADGGEGTTQSLVDATGGSLYHVNVMGPDGTPVSAPLGVLGDGKTAVLEMAGASGLQLLPIEKRNPWFTTTYGTGQLIQTALDKGMTQFVIGIGGSATNDAGAGVFQALGGKLLDKDGHELPFGGGALGLLDRIDISQMDPRIKDITVEVACDVTNPLTGPQGASYTYGPQKGADPVMVEELDKNLKHFAAIIKRDLGVDVDQIPGAGSAGGLGAGLLAFMNATLSKGIDLVVRHTSLVKEVSDADFVITGEGSIDAQTQYGKTPIGVSKVAQHAGVPTVVVAGTVHPDARVLYEHGITAIFSILQSPGTLQDAIESSYDNVAYTTENIARLLQLKKA